MAAEAMPIFTQIMRKKVRLVGERDLKGASF
jgi:hypothetical protein